MKSYKFLDDVAIADIAFEAEADSLNGVFIACGEAVFETISDVEKVDKIKVYDISLKSDTLEKLLYDFLETIVYYKDTDSVVFNSCEVKIEEKDNNFLLKGKIYGEYINRNKHELYSDVKAITMHMFKLEKKGDNYKATVVLDI
ncbi:MAG: archease [Nanoarchaeota archaeon]|nr:archease [Nanoarchaeota archaeon]